MKPKTSSKAFELAQPAKSKVVLRLYIAGSSDRSLRAIQNAKQICDDHLAGTYELEVIDIFQQPKLAKDDQILAVPTLIKKLPLPLRRFIGDLSDTDVVLVGLDVKHLASHGRGLGLDVGDRLDARLERRALERREPDLELAAAADAGTAHLDRSSVEYDEATDDREAKSEPTLGSVDGARALDEPVEQRRQEVRRNPHAVVANDDDKLVTNP